MQRVSGPWRVTAGTLNIPNCLQGAGHAVPSWEHLSVVAMGPQREHFTPKGALLPELENGAGMGPRAAGINVFSGAATKLQMLHPP